MQPQVENEFHDGDIRAAVRLLTVNTHWEQDRAEIRETHERVLKMTLYVITALFAIAGFAAHSEEHGSFVACGAVFTVLVYRFYSDAWREIREVLIGMRNCQAVRESFYKRPEQLFDENFDPIRKPNELDLAHAFTLQDNDNELRLPFKLTRACFWTTLAFITLLLIRNIIHFGSFSYLLQ
jgi:hypothetical protein